MAKSIAEQYSKEMCKHFGGGYYAVWEPGVKIQLGDIGVLNNYVFTQIGSVLIEPCNLIFTVREGINPIHKAMYVSEGSVNWSILGDAQVAPMNVVLNNIGAGVALEFSKEKSTFFEALNIKHHTIENKIVLGNSILALYKKGIWKKQWVVVTEVSVAGSATILISQTAGAKVEIKASASIGAAGISLADPSLGLSFQNAKGLGYQTLAQEGITYKVKLLGVKHPFLSNQPQINLMSEEETECTPGVDDETSTLVEIENCADWPVKTD